MARIPDAVIQRLKQEVSLERLVQELGTDFLSPFSSVPPYSPEKNFNLERKQSKHGLVAHRDRNSLTPPPSNPNAPNPARAAASRYR